LPQSLRLLRNDKLEVCICSRVRRRNYAGFLLRSMIALCGARVSLLAAEPANALASIPRVELHAHAGSLEMTDSLVQIADRLKERHGIHIAAFFNLQPFQPVGSPPLLTPESFAEIESRYKGRILSCIGDYNLPGGLRYSPDELAAWQKRGVVGYKIWHPTVTGPTAPAKDQFTYYAPDYPGIDAPALEPNFAAMERLGLVGTCVHIGQAHPRRWQNPVHFWTQIHAWLRVIDRHPRMVVVMAHMMNLFYSDEQLDFLAYVLETYPNLHVELGGRFIDFGAMEREHLRGFFIRYADRILFGTDFAPSFLRDGIERAAEDYFDKFRVLETADLVEWKVSYAKPAPYRGLALPKNVLEKIYYRNAARLYPRLKTVLTQQGYKVE
jgi:predicted TIM-barrel fold metal-dependent hydrolase